MFTRTELRRLLRQGGCLRPRDHIKGIEAKAPRASFGLGPMRCYLAHPPHEQDEVAADQRWFIRVPVRTKRLLRKPWRFSGATGSRRHDSIDEQMKFSPKQNEFAYRSTRAITYRKDLTRPIPFSSEREDWQGVRDDI